MMMTTKDRLVEGQHQQDRNGSRGQVKRNCKGRHGAVHGFRKNTNIATASVSNTTVTVTGVNAGSTTLTISDKNRKTALVSITVKGIATGLTVDKSTVNVAVGKEETVNISGGTTPYTATSSSTATATAAVSGQKVTIKGVKAGTATITVTDKNKKTVSIKVTVK